MAEAEQQVCSFFLQGKCNRKKKCPYAHPIIEIAAAEKPKAEKKVVEKPKKTPLELANEAVTEQGDRVRDLKSKKAPKPEVDAAVAKLLELKNKVKELGGEVAGGEKKDDKKKGGKDAKAVGGGVKSDKKQKKKKGEEEEGGDDAEEAAAPAAAAAAPAEAKPKGEKKPKEKAEKPKKEEAAADASAPAPAAEKAEKKEKGGKKEKGAKPAATEAPAAAEKPASRKTSSADEPAKPAAKAARKPSNVDEAPAASKAKPASRKTSSADEPAKPASRKPSSADENKGGKKSRSNSNLHNDDEKAIKAAQRAPVDLNDPFLLKYKTFSDSPVLGKAAPSLDSLKFLGEAKAPGRDAPLALLFWSVYYTGGYKFLPLYSDLNKLFKGKVNVLGVSIDPDVAAPKKWIEDPEKKYSKGEFPTSIPLAYDEGKKVYDSFRDLLQNTLNIPHLFLIDKKGVIVWHQDHSQIGGTCYDWMDMIERQIKALLGGKALESFGPAPVEEEEADAEAVSGSFDPNDLF